MSDTRPATLEHDGPLAVLTLRSPPVNLLDEAMLGALEEALAALHGAPPRGLLIRASGRVVSGGVDVALFHETTPVDGEVLFRRMLAITHGVEALPCPTVFAAHALCLTWAFEVSLACDIVLAADSARFGLVERTVGLTPSMGGTQRLAHRAGPARARELVMTGDLFDAATLHAWGVVNRVLPDAGFDDAALAFARGLAAGPTRAHAATKVILAAFQDGGVRAADDAAPPTVAALLATADARAAIGAFVEHGPGGETEFVGR